MGARLNNTDEHVLGILQDHGATVFTEADQSASAAKMLKSGHVIEYGKGAVAITSKGLRWLETH